MNAAALTIVVLLTTQVTFPGSQPSALESRETTAGGPVQRELKSVLRTSGEVESATANAVEPPLSPVKSAVERGAAPEILAQGLTAPAEGALAGRPMSLVEVLGRTSDRNQQLLLTRAYWKLSLATAGYNFAVDENTQIEAVADPNPAGAALLQTAKTAAAARVREAELLAMESQHELADLMFLPPGEPLPLTADVPHVGSYRTYFETLFATRTPPGRARLIDRALPIRREVIELRAAAVQSSSEATNSAQQALAESSSDIRSVLAAHAALFNERRSFLAAVGEYNDDIAEYAMAVAQIGTSEIVLVSMLIKTPQTVSSGERREPTPASPTNEVSEPGRLNWTPPRANSLRTDETQSSEAAEPQRASPSSALPQGSPFSTPSTPSVMKSNEPATPPGSEAAEPTNPFAKRAAAQP